MANQRMIECTIIFIEIIFDQKRENTGKTLIALLLFSVRTRSALNQPSTSFQTANHVASQSCKTHSEEGAICPFVLCELRGTHNWL